MAPTKWRLHMHAMCGLFLWWQGEDMPHRHHHRRSGRRHRRSWRRRHHHSPAWNAPYAPPSPYWSVPSPYWNAPPPYWNAPTWNTGWDGGRPWDGRWPYPIGPVDPVKSCIESGRTREGVLFLERDCAGFPVGPRCCADQKEVVYCNGNVHGGMSVGALQCLQRD